jgi:hypothetical protein
MPQQHAHGTMTAEQLDVLTRSGHLDLDGLEQLPQRLDDMPASGRAVCALNGVECATPRGTRLEVYPGCFPPRTPVGQRANRRAGVCRTRSPRRERGPSCARTLGTRLFTAATSAISATAVPKGGCRDDVRS